MHSWRSGNNMTRQPRHQLGTANDLMSLRYPHEWVTLKDLPVGQIFWAALKHPHHPHVTNRLYLVIDRIVQTVGDQIDYVAIAVIALETNGGLGASCYSAADQAYLMGFRIQSSEIAYDNADGPNVFEHHERDVDKSDRRNFYITDWSTPDWTLLPNTVADLTTVLVIQAPSVLCRKTGNLSLQSYYKIAEVYVERLQFLDPEIHSAIMVRRTPKIPVNRQVTPYRAPPRRYQHNINPQPVIYDPLRSPFQFTWLRNRHGEDDSDNDE
ncbi:hypothetical protein K491DRAFT_784178 [Lophiostoma macrostomum CBS 122681]|uniref:Uncharacterized protein n=1 Tax=Lophiostoma macrostomum CBS 122681 TaxID=1314788 RepID=A0A6A6SQ31_9PLEO|nr:hypothetical protein K491DRAFT_784178 [Lophiostoma macrostomum CBS 122681]